MCRLKIPSGADEIFEQSSPHRPQLVDASLAFLLFEAYFGRAANIIIIIKSMGSKNPSSVRKTFSCNGPIEDRFFGIIFIHNARSL
jgi:hypothetical protein